MILTMSLTATAGVGAWYATTDILYRGRVLHGVTVQGEPVGGLEPAALAARITAQAGPALQRPILLRAGPVESTAPAAAVGLRASVHRASAAALAVGRTGPIQRRLRERARLLRGTHEIVLPYQVDAEAARDAIRTLVAPIVATPRDAVVEVIDGRLRVQAPSQDGVVVDEPASLARLAVALLAGAPEVDLAVQLRRPAFTTEDADAMGEPLANFTTRFPFNPDRVHNIHLAASALRGHLLLPGTLFSFNEAVGPRDAARGYRKAPVLFREILIPGDGGGVCQVSSTLFNAAVLAGMTVEARSNHSQPVPYLPAGLDATVDYGFIDLRLRNTTGGPLYLWTEVGPRSLRVTIFGRREPGREVRIVTADHLWLPAPGHTVTRRDPFLPLGERRIDEPKPGLRVRTVRVLQQHGAVVREDVVATSYYAPVPRLIRIGAKAPEARSAAPGTRAP